MPDTRHHRGPHPEDARLFVDSRLPSLRQAVSDLSLLLSRGYGEKSALKLVGDRYQLTSRQRVAVLRSSCADEALEGRCARHQAVEQLRNAPLHVDGYNLLVCVESAMGGGVILVGRDGCLRDLASVHGTYRTVEETIPAVQLIGEVLAELAPGAVHWYFNAPVSNSGRLKELVSNLADDRGWCWTAQLVPDPDTVLISCNETVVSSDSRILDNCRVWVNLASEVITRRISTAWMLSLIPKNESHQ